MRWSNPGAIIENTIRSRKLSEFLSKRGRMDTLLDLGCGPRPYFSIYQPYFKKTIGADLEASPFPKENIDLYCPVTDVPLPDQSVDMILCTEVLHDIAEPDAFFLEVKRLLKPSGVLFLTSPFVVPIVDGSYDHYRYTRYGLTYRIEKSGLQVASISPVGDIFSTTITLAVKPILKFFNALAKATKLKFIYTAYNPFLFLMVVLPQLTYLFLAPLPGIRNLLKRFDYGPIGYVSIAGKNT